MPLLIAYGKHRFFHDVAQLLSCIVITIGEEGARRRAGRLYVCLHFVESRFFLPGEDCNL